jgi:hypothetical protein
MIEERRAASSGRSPAVFANGTSISSTIPLAVSQRTSAPGTRRAPLPAERDSTEAFDAALAANGIRVQETLHVDVPPVSRAAVARGGDRLVLRPAPAAGAVEVVYYQDESGGVSWHFAERSTASLRGRRAARFAIPLRTAAARTSLVARGGQSRGLVTKIGRKILKVLVIPIVSPMLAAPVTSIVRRIERRYRQELVRPLSPDDFRHRVTEPVRDWKRLTKGPVLLVIHGITSTTEGMLAGLSQGAMADLHSLYQGRVIALDQLTLTHDPEENARFFLDQVRRAGLGTELVFDLLCHSRGGIVGRVLAERGRHLVPDVGVRCRKVYFAGVPNQGSPLADPEHIVDMLDVMTNLATNFPDGPLTYSFEIILAIVKLVATAAEKSLPGLAAMGTKGFIAKLNRSSERLDTVYRGAGSDYQPDPAHDNGFFTGTFVNAIMDRVFSKKGGPVANDLVVPCDGVVADNGHPSFPIRGSLIFSAADQIWHSGYFAAPRLVKHMMDFFGEREGAGTVRRAPARRLDYRIAPTAPPLLNLDEIPKLGGVAEAVEGPRFRFRRGTARARSPHRGPVARSAHRGARARSPHGGRILRSPRPNVMGAARPPAPVRREVPRAAGPREKKPPPAASPAERRRSADVVSREPRIMFHEQVRAGQKNDLVVYLRDLLPNVPSAARTRITIARGEETTTLMVSLSAPGFSVEPRRELPLVVGRDFDAERERVTFQLTADEPPGGMPFSRDIRADLWHGNSSLGGAVHYTTVVPRAHHGPAPSDGRSRSSSFALRAPEQECDLVIIVESRNERGIAPFMLKLRGEDATGHPYEFRRVGTLNLPPRQLGKMLRDQFAEFASSYPEGKPEAEVRRWRTRLLDKIEVLGKWLWSRLPAEFRAEYFKFYDARRLPESIIVQSDETIIPWELIVPFRNGRKLPPLGKAHVMGRWDPTLGLRPRPQQVTVTRAAIMNPRDAGLHWSTIEAAHLRGLSPSFEALKPVDRGTFNKLMKRTDVNLVHFTGHGLFGPNADLSALQLEGGDQVTPIDFIGVRLLAKAQPILYLNACEAGESGVVMGQMGGFSIQCAVNGCGGIIAPYWAVSDDSAAEFSKAFYEKLTVGRSIGEALRELRQERPKDPTFQAFGYLGDPWTRTHFDLPPASRQKSRTGGNGNRKRRSARAEGVHA